MLKFRHKNKQKYIIRAAEEVIKGKHDDHSSKSVANGFWHSDQYEQ